MAAKRLSSAQLIRKLCHELGHEEGAAPCVKRIVQEHWLEKVEHLRRVPKSRFERWGIPLKLADELEDLFTEVDADDQLHNMQAYVNYTVRPTLQQFAGSANPFANLKEDAEKRRNPKNWAAKKIQRNFRRRKEEEKRMETERLEQALLVMVDSKEVSVMSDDKSQELREKRALEKIRRAVRRWKARKKTSGLSIRASFTSIHVEDLTDYYNMCPAGAGSAVVAVEARQCMGALKDCEVTTLLKRFAKKMQREWEDIMPYAHRIVTFNWIEKMQDLDLIEDRHWDEWDFPELLVVLIKAEVEANGRPGMKAAACSCFTGTASCCIGDCVGACCDALSGWWSYSDEKEKQKAREDERRRFEKEEEEEPLPPPAPAKLKARPQFQGKR